MGIVIVVLITAIVIWKSIYSIILIKKFSKEKNKKHKWINIILLSNYFIYFYFLYMAASGLLKSPLEGPLWLIILFIGLTMCNVFYDLKRCKINN